MPPNRKANPVTNNIPSLHAPTSKQGVHEAITNTVSTTDLAQGQPIPIVGKDKILPSDTSRIGIEASGLKATAITTGTNSDAPSPQLTLKATYPHAAFMSESTPTLTGEIAFQEGEEWVHGYQALGEPRRRADIGALGI